MLDYKTDIVEIGQKMEEAEVGPIDNHNDNLINLIDSDQ